MGLKRTRIVPISLEILTTYLKTGTRIISPDGREITCVAGLPADATFEAGFMSAVRSEVNLVFSSATFPEVQEGNPAPRYLALYETNGPVQVHKLTRPPSEQTAEEFAKEWLSDQAILRGEPYLTGELNHLSRIIQARDAAQRAKGRPELTRPPRPSFPIAVIPDDKGCHGNCGECKKAQ